MSELTDAIAASVGPPEDTAAQTVATPEPAPATETPTETPAAPDTAAPDAATESEWNLDSADFDEKHPDLARYRKQLQADYTRRTQDLAEQRRSVEGLDPGSIEWVRQVTGLARTQPQLAAQMLEAERQRLMGAIPSSQQQPEPQPEVWLSDGERLLHERVQRQEQELQQIRQASQRSAVEAETAQLERTIGKTLNSQERNDLYMFCASKPGLNLEEGWKLRNYDKAIQMGRDQSAAVAAQKNGMGPAPGGVASREAPAANREPQSRREAIQMAYEEAERRTA